MEEKSAQIPCNKMYKKYLYNTIVEIQNETNQLTNDGIQIPDQNLFNPNWHEL